MVARFKVGKGRVVAVVGRIARPVMLGVVMALSTYYGFCILCLLLYNVIWLFKMGARQIAQKQAVPAYAV